MENRNNNLISLGKLANKLNISVVWLKEQADKNVIPHIKAGKKILINEKAVIDVLVELAAKGGKK